MKNAKKLLSVVLALTLVFAFSAIAFAGNGGDHTITINGTVTGHVYEAYQVFAGTVAKDGDTKYLSNITWGNGVNSENLITALTEAGIIVADAPALADYLEENRGNNEVVKKVAKIIGANLATVAGESTANGATYTISGLTDGYYLVKDKNEVTGNDFATDYILEVVEDVRAIPKGDKASVTKEIYDVNDSTNEGTWGETADHDIGDNVSYKLTGKLPSNYADYEAYSYKFVDTLSAGLTYNNDAIVKIDGTEVNASKYTVTYVDQVLTVEFDDLKTTSATATSVITVEYTATLNTDAVVGGAGNDNTVYLEYSNNPNGEGTGTTPKDEVKVYTYKVIINKVDEAEAPLAGAEFKLEKVLADGSKKEITLTENDAGTSFTATGLDDGKYILTETKAPETYNTLPAPIEFTITATVDGTAITELKGEGATFAVDLTEGSLTTEILNQKGTQLPSTGGIGTTIFYVVGAILVLAAGVILISKRRMSEAM